MNTMTRTLLLLAFLLGCNQALAEEQATFPGTQALMTAEEFNAAGLHKLNQAERNALDRWLQRYNAGEVPLLTPTAQAQVAVPASQTQRSIQATQAQVAARAPAATPAATAQVTAPGAAKAASHPSDPWTGAARQDDGEEILSSLKPSFGGWSGATVFYLENGQVWKQRRRGNYKHSDADMRVKISKNFMGFYKLTMLSSGKSVQVKRVR